MNSNRNSEVQSRFGLVENLDSCQKRSLVTPREQTLPRIFVANFSEGVSHATTESNSIQTDVKTLCQVKSALFDEPYYSTTYPEVLDSKIEPWVHFCQIGFRENRNPHPVFHTKFYRQKYLAASPDVNPLVHYVQAREQLLDTHPLFDSSFYLSQIGQTIESLWADKLTPLQHFLKHNRENLASPSPLFSSRRYLEKHRDIAACKANPLVHFLVYGKRGQRQSFLDVEHLKLFRFRSAADMDRFSFLEIPHQKFIGAMANSSLRQTIVCVSHEASQTGAPSIILKIAEQLRATYGLDVINLVCRGGELVQQFEQLGPTMVLGGCSPTHSPAEYAGAMDLFGDLANRANVMGVLLNSAQSRHLLPELRKLNVPIHSLVHEDARCYKSGEFRLLAEHSDKVIFPSAQVQQAAFDNTDFSTCGVQILSQGLLDAKLLESKPHDPKSRVRQKWNIPLNATLVLACGTPNARKGLDLFISTAVIALSKVPRGSLYFGWLGAAEKNDRMPNTFWALKDLELAGISEYVRFFGETEEVAPFFQACDLFFLPSRIDPFPCVVNEAMAVAKPVVLFDNGNGCVELIKNDGGAVVPYGNVALAAEAILELTKYPSFRIQIGQRNRGYVAENMNFDTYVESLMRGLVATMGDSRYEISQNDAYQPLCSRVYSHSDQRRVIFALPDWHINGVNTFVENLIIELRNHGFDAFILFTTPTASKVPPQFMPRVPYRFLTSTALTPEQHRQRVIEYLTLNAPCIFVPNYDYISSSVAPKLPDNIGVLGVLHSDDDEHYLHGYQLGHYWHTIVTVSDTIKNKLLQLNPAFASRTQTIRYGVPAMPADYDKTMSTDRIRIIYTGRIIQKQKRIFDFLELAEQLSIKRVPFEMTFIGTGDETGALIQKFQPWVQQKIVRFLGRCTPTVVAEELKNHDVFVLTSEYEGLPLSLLEAMSHHCVPVVTDIPSGIKEILMHRDNAMLSPVGAMAEMANNLAILHRDRVLLQQMAQRAHQTLEDCHLTAPKMGEQYHAILETMFQDIAAKHKRVVVPLDCPRIGALLKAA